MEELLDFLRANAALMVSALAVLLTAYSVRATQKHNRLMVQPRLSTFVTTNADSASACTVQEVILSNSGLGPAIIKKYEVLLDGKPVEATVPNDFYLAIVQAIAANFLANQCQFGILRKDYVMAKDEELQAAKITLFMATEAQLEELKRFHLRVTYESAYGEPFTYDSRVHMAEPQHWSQKLKWPTKKASRITS